MLIAVIELRWPSYKMLYTSLHPEIHPISWDEMRWDEVFPQELAGKFFSLPLVAIVEEGGGVRHSHTEWKFWFFPPHGALIGPDQTFSTLHMGPIQKCMMTMMLKGWWSCLLGLLNPRLKLPQPDHTEQRASLPYCQGGDKCTTSVTIPWLH